MLKIKFGKSSQYLLKVISSGPFINTNYKLFSFANNVIVEDEDEVESLNKSIRNMSQKTHTLNKSSFKLDIIKDVKNYFKNKNSVKEENKDIRKNLNKLSAAERVTIGKDEDLDNLNIRLHSEMESDSILDAVFNKGTNSEFIKKLDKVYEVVKNEELKTWERLGKSKNLYAEEIEDKDITDLEDDEDIYIEEIN